MQIRKLLLVVAAICVFGPPFLFTLISLFTLFMYLTDPWGGACLFVILGLPLGTIAVGLIIRVGYNKQPKLEPRHPGWDEPETGWDGRDAPPGFKFRNG